jgi:hypothetical protein
MKPIYALLIFSNFLFSSAFLKSQTINNAPVLSLKTANSVLFGKDIIINDQPSQNQRQAGICSAFNGWLFSAYSYINVSNIPELIIMKSTDNGMSWTIFKDGTIPPDNTTFKSMHIVTIGDSISNLKIIISGVTTYGSDDIGEGFIYRINAVTADFEATLFADPFTYDIAISTDKNFPANNSNPSSVGALCSKYSANKDSIIFLSSSNGGMSFDNRKTVAISGEKFHKVALAYGRSSTFPNGNYYATWDEHANFGSIPGHIYTSHSYPYFNSSFTVPKNLDSMNVATINMSRNPSIACQNNNVENDSSNVTEVVLFECYDQLNGNYNTKGYYNLQAANHYKFRPFAFTDSLHYNIQTDINFNPYDSTFMVTYFDSTAKHLPFITHNFNFINPNQWNIVSSGYNDSSNISAPYPKVEISPSLHKGLNVWIGERNNNNGLALFDSPSSTWTGLSDTHSNSMINVINIFPNPCQYQVTISFELKKTDNVNIDLSNLFGQRIEIITDQTYHEGTYLIPVDVSNLPMGLYIFNFKINNWKASGKFSIIR